MEVAMQDNKLEKEGRRGFMRTQGLITLGTMAAVTLGRSGGAWGATMSKNPESDVSILNTALALEYQAIAAYQVGAQSGLLQKPVLDVAVKFQGQHKAHAQALAGLIHKMGGTPVEAMKAADYHFPVEKLKTQADVLQFAAGLEKGAASAYLGAVPVFHDKDLSKAAASILGDETMHWAILLNALGQDPVPAAFIG
ncbi:MAG: ferritin-like domain-containing protein [Burkholderiales bacterium]|nr:ferritin-like domain-containing protein [Burkholderiales bacterium]MDE2289063.1 ferritin-like domain-containing protein [Burkholderiales bacterium]MDE2609811.1 ferritin-like domain-containing protein [Burkholderiales bacterium]